MSVVHKVVQVPTALEMTDEEFLDFCQVNRDLRIERNPAGDILIMPPAIPESSSRNLELAAQLRIWAKRDGTGVGFDSSAGFQLPNRAVRSPDAAWVLKTRIAKLSSEEKKKFWPLCPDFVAELRSYSDRLSVLQDKMREYIGNGARLGWLIDPYTRQVLVYRPGAAVKRLRNPQTLKGDPVLCGFVLDLTGIWKPDF